MSDEVLEEVGMSRINEPGERPVRRYAMTYHVHRFVLEDEPMLKAVIRNASEELHLRAAADGLELIGEVSYQLQKPEPMLAFWEAPRPWWHRLIPRRVRPRARLVEAPYVMLVESRAVCAGV